MADSLLPENETGLAQVQGSPICQQPPTPPPLPAARQSAGPARRRRLAQAGMLADIERRRQLGLVGLWLRGLLRQTPSWLVSTVFHALLLLGLGLWALPQDASDDPRQLVVTPGENEGFEQLEELQSQPLERAEVAVADMSDVAAAVTAPDSVDISSENQLQATPAAIEPSEFGLERGTRTDLLATVGTVSGTGISGRGSGTRAVLVRKHGGSVGSEKAVANGLKWLAAHQLADGGWNFNHAAAPKCRGKCRDVGTMSQARIAATALGILPFLGAGQTHKAGEYRDTVQRGLYFLLSHQRHTPQGGALNERGGRMYSHGLASIALCEAYAMTQDKNLQTPARNALYFICNAQDPVGGGWRYEPRSPGDTSVVGWQLMALKSGHLAYLRVPPLTIKKASDFLDSVQANSGANYGYLGPGSGEATTAIGLLCRMYLGWKREHPALQRGVEWLSERGPSEGNMYYNYYATLVMRYWEGEEWKKWNGVMRDQLVNSQATVGHEDGSWHISRGGDRGASSGGRLYCTAMAVMILEVYYRYLPIYRSQSIDDEFRE